MALILPSEIARLVFGYLEENECVEAAANFLTTSPHLQECRHVTQRGRKFGTKLEGHTLTDIIEKYFLVMQFVKERLSKTEDCDSQPADLMAMIKLLLDGPPRGQQRFVVNINVPQPQAGGSPILASSSRKRRISNPPDRDKCKRMFKLNSEKEKGEGAVPAEPATTQLPGHSEAAQESGGVKSLGDVQSMTTEIKIKETVVEINKENKVEPMKNSTATDTEELMLYSTAEVQTQADHIESDGELEPDTPIGNLSLLTKEMLNRTEIQEKIAEKINKAGLLPNLSSVIKETSLCENVEVNTSVMTELNNAIKSVVTTTETDPVFEEFLNEIIGTTDESPDGSPQDSNPTERFNKELKIEPGTNPAEEEEFKVKPEKILDLNEPMHETLDDLNAAAIQSIINANKITRETSDFNEENEDKKPLSPIDSLANEIELPPASPVTELSIGIPSSSINIPLPSFCSAPSSILTTIPEMGENSVIIPRRGRLRKPARQAVQKTKPKIVSDEEVVTTLVICPQENANKVYEPPLHPPMLLPAGTTSYVPIRPKPSSETIYLRAVQVPKNAKPPPPPPPPLVLPMNQFKPLAPKIPNQSNLSAKPIEKKKNQEDEPVTSDFKSSTVVDDLKSPVKTTDMPMLTVDDSISFSSTGLSPFLKLNKRKRSPETKTPPATEILPTIDLTSETSLAVDKIQESTHEIIKRTPKSLLKSRASNHRLSLSTPRRRSSHVRVLDFSTPTGLNSSRRYSVASARTSPLRPLNKSIPRSSLFSTPTKSPKKKIPAKTPVRSLKPVETPIATRSPAPTLQGNWNKVSGVDTIIGCDSQSDSCVSPPKKRPKSWDADLREGIVVPEENPKELRRNSSKSSKNDKEEINNEFSIPAEKLEVKEENTEAKSSVKIAQSTIVTAKGVTKKYVKLKTLSAKTTGSNDLSSSFETSRCEKEIGDLETPRKFDDIGVPPTPRIISPSSNPSSFVRTHSEETKVAGIVNTPEFPVTPCINITPKHGDNIADSLKKDYALYYDPGMYEKPGKNKEVESNQNPKATASTSASAESELDTSGAKLEITQFEVIKENLTKEETCKELRISNAEGVNKSKESEKNLENSRSDDSDSDSDTSSSSSCSSSSCYSDDQSKSKSRLSVSKRSNLSSKSDNLGLDLSDSVIKTDDKSLVDDNKEKSHENKVNQDDEQVHDSSGDQESEQAEKDEKNDSAELVIEEPKAAEEIQNDKFGEENDLLGEKEKVGEVADKSEEIVEEEELQINENTIEDGEIVEKSPQKVFTLIKSDKALAEADIETPAKNDELLDEADISETPSGSKNGTETATINLTTKISKLINASSHWQQENKTVKSVGIDPKINNDMSVPNQPESFDINHDILKRELDEKRLRMMDKLKTKITVKPLYGGSKRRDRSNDKTRPRTHGNNEGKDKIRGGYEARDRAHGNNNNARYAENANNYEEKDRGHRGHDARDRLRELQEEKTRSRRSNEKRDKSRDRNEERGRSYRSNEDRGRSYGSNEDRGRSYGSNEDRGRSYGSNEDRGRRDDKVRNQRTDYDKDKKDYKVRNQRTDYDKNKKDDKVNQEVKCKVNLDNYEKRKEEKVKINVINHQVKDRKEERLKSLFDERKDKKEEKSEQVKDKVKSQETKDVNAKEEINKNKDGWREGKLPVVPVTRKSARNAARTAKNEADEDKKKCDNDKEKKKPVEDKSKSSKDKAGFQQGKILEHYLKERLLKESTSKAKADQAPSNKEEVRKIDDKEKKMKVDAVKRDLFSGDEMSDAEGKKIAAYQVEELMMQLHKSDTPEVPETEDLSDKNMVLESLKLQPATKSSSESEINLSMNHCEIKFVHDDNVNSKKRYRKTTVDVVPITIPTEDGDITVTLTLTPHEELFSLQPARVKKVTKKDLPKLAPEPIRYKRKVQLRDSKPIVTSIEPLATSSPFIMEQPGTSKVVKPELAKAENTNQVQIKKERGDKTNQETTSKNSDNKLTDPKLLLSKLNQLKIDKLLATVHGPE